MRQFFKITILVAVFALLVFGTVAWKPINRGIAPPVRDKITEIQDTIDPGTYAIFMDDFFEFPQSTVWDTTSVVVDAGSIVAIVDSLGYPGCLKFTLGATSKGPLNGFNLQTVNAPFMLTASPANPDSNNVYLEFETRVMVNNATQSNLFAGLTIEDESLSTGDTKALMFVKHDNSSTIYAKEINANTAAMDSSSCGTFAARTWYRLKIVWTGWSARFYVNDVYKCTLSTAANRPVATHLKPTIEIASGDSTQTFGYLDYVYVKKAR